MNMGIATLRLNKKEWSDLSTSNQLWMQGQLPRAPAIICQ